MSSSPHPIPEMGRQAGASEAIVDRVLNHRGGESITRSTSPEFRPVVVG